MRIRCRVRHTCERWSSGSCQSGQPSTTAIASCAHPRSARALTGRSSDGPSVGSHKRTGIRSPGSHTLSTIGCSRLNLRTCTSRVFLFTLSRPVVLFLALQDITGDCWKSISVGAFYALRPLNVERVAWASERKTVPCMFFFMLALWGWSRYTRQRTAERYMTHRIRRKSPRLLLVGAVVVG